MQQQVNLPPRAVRLIIKIARFGEFKDEYEEFFELAFEDKLKTKGESAARRWSYFFAAKTLFFAALEWGKLVAIIYLKVSGK